MGKIVNVYIDDMVVKLEKHQNRLDSLQTIFDELLQYNLWLNPLKCLFGLTSSKYLGYLKIRQGIKAKFEQIEQCWKCHLHQRRKKSIG